MLELSVSSSRAGRLPLVGCVAALMSLFFLLWMDVIPYGDELQQFPRALHTLDSNWLNHDLFVGAPQGDHWLYFRFVGALFWIAGPYGGAIAARLVIWLLAAASLVSLGKSLTLRPAAIVLGAVLFASVQQFVMAGETLIGEAIARHLSYPFVWFALACWARGRFAWAAVLLGAATSCHFLVGAWAVLVMILALPFDQRIAGKRLRVAGSCAVLFLIAAAPGWVPMLPLILEAGHGDASQADRIFVFLRHPHHLHPASWPWDDYAGFAASCVLFAVLGRSRLLSRAVANIRLYVWAAIVLTVFALIAGLAAEPASFLKLHPYRFGPPLLALIVSLLTAEWLIQNPRTVVRIAGPLCVLALAAMHAPRGSYHFLRHARASVSSDEAARLDSLRWIRTASAPATSVLANPTWSETPWVARRAAAFSFKLVPFEVPRILEWFRRMEAVVGVPRDSRPGHEMMAAIGGIYDKLNASDLIERAKKVNADLVIGHVPCDSGAGPVYENSHYCIYPTRAFEPVNQNYLVLRYDDYAPVSPYAGPPRRIETEQVLFRTVAWHKGVVSVGVIPFPISAAEAAAANQAPIQWLSDAVNPWTRLLREFVSLGVVEPALHGYEHKRRSEPGFRPGEYRRQPPEWQKETIQLGQQALVSAVGKQVEVFIPPWNAWDAATIEALKFSRMRWLSPDLHHAKTDGAALGIVPQCTFDPLAALEAMKSTSSLPDGSIMVLVMHPFDFEVSAKANEYRAGVESVVAYAEAAPAWKSVGFSGLPAASDSAWTSRFDAAVQWNRFAQVLDDGRHSTHAPSTMFRPYEWYQDNLWRVRLPVVGFLVAVSALTCFVCHLLSRAAVLSTTAVAAMLVLVAALEMFLVGGAWAIHNHDYAVRGLRWLAICAAAGCAAGLFAETFRRLKKARGSRRSTGLQSAAYSTEEPVFVA